MLLVQNVAYSLISNVARHQFSWRHYVHHRVSRPELYINCQFERQPQSHRHHVIKYILCRSEPVVRYSLSIGRQVSVDWVNCCGACVHRVMSVLLVADYYCGWLYVNDVATFDLNNCDSFSHNNYSSNRRHVDIAEWPCTSMSLAMHGLGPLLRTPPPKKLKLHPSPSQMSSLGSCEGKYNCVLVDLEPTDRRVPERCPNVYCAGLKWKEKAP